MIRRVFPRQGRIEENISIIQLYGNESFAIPRAFRSSSPGAGCGGVFHVLRNHVDALGSVHVRGGAYPLEMSSRIQMQEKNRRGSKENGTPATEGSAKLTAATRTSVSTVL